MKFTKLATLCITGVVAFTFSTSPSVFAQQEDFGHIIAGNVTNNTTGEDIDTSRMLTLTVKKVGQNPYDDVQNESLQLQGDTLELYIFSGVDVTDEKTRKDILSGALLDEINDDQLRHIDSKITDSKGVAKFNNLKAGLYMLKDTALNRSEIIMMPLADVEGERFIYDNNTVIMKNIQDTTPPPTKVTPPSQVDEPTPSPSQSIAPPEKTQSNTTTQTSPQHKDDRRSTTPPQISTPVGDVPNGKGGGSPTPGESTGDKKKEMTPLFPGGPAVNTGGFVVPSPFGGNISLLSMILALSALVLTGGYLWKKKGQRVTKDQLN